MSASAYKETLLPEEDAQKDKYLTFALDDQLYGMEIRYVTEIIGIQSITPVPELPEYIRGIINLRGKIIPVMDVRLRFHKEARAYTDRTCIIVADLGGAAVGLIVDRVTEVLTIAETEIVPPPEINQGRGSFMKGIGKTGGTVSLILDCGMMLSTEEINTLELV